MDEARLCQRRKESIGGSQSGRKKRELVQMGLKEEEEGERCSDEITSDLRWNFQPFKLNEEKSFVIQKVSPNFMITPVANSSLEIYSNACVQHVDRGQSYTISQCGCEMNLKLLTQYSDLISNWRQLSYLSFKLYGKEGYSCS